MLFYSTIFGSKLYGTNLETSDTDYRNIEVPSMSELLSLTNLAWELSWKTDDAEGVTYSWRKYHEMLKSQQLTAIELLFAPSPYKLAGWLDPKELSFCVSKKVTAELVSIEREILSYSNKTEALSAIRALIESIKTYLTKHNSTEKAQEYLRSSDFDLIYTQYPSVFIKGEKDINNTTIEYLSVNNKQFEATSNLMLWISRLTNMEIKYDSKIQSFDSLDVEFKRKQFCHILRRINEIKELLQTGKLTFPCQQSDLYKTILTDKRMTLSSVLVLIATALNETRRAAEESTLPEAPNYEFLRDWYERVQMKYLCI